MLAAMVWSLLIPAIAMAESAGTPSWLPALTGFLLGAGSLLGLDALLNRMQARPERASMLTLAVTLHNLPEGMAVGVALAGLLSGKTEITTAAAAALSLGIAIQNIPEGAIISAPLAAAGKSRLRAFSSGALSGAVEPLGAVLTLLLTRQITALLPYVLAFAAGCMLYVVAVELIPETQEGEKSPAGPIGTALGFAVMMLLDVMLG
jgi:ZIP family zinc transporter